MRVQASHLQRGCHTNLFLRSLRPGDAVLLQPMLSRVECGCGETLATQAAGGGTVYFPETVVVAVAVPGGTSAVGLIGREGMVGWAGLLGPKEDDYRARVTMGGGSALTISATRLRDACFVSPTLALSVLRFVQTFTIQMSWSLLAARRDSLSERLCGLLVMIHDRIDGDEIPATHRALAAHLGVRRATITDTLHILEGERVLRSERGRILIRDRKLIELLAGASHAKTQLQSPRDAPFASAFYNLPD